MYRYCKTFNCSPREYEERPYKESTWLLEIDRVYEEAIVEQRGPITP